MSILAVVTIVSLFAAVSMSAVAWRLAAEERRRSSARVAALALELHDADLEFRPREPERSATRVPAPDLFTTARPVESSGRFAAAIACGVIVVGGIATVGLLVAAGSRPESHASAAPATAPATPAAAIPLELLALGHERTGDDLTVRGLVRNPSSGVAVDRLTAVVFLFNRDGSFLTSGRAAVESPALVPGGESRFVVTVPSAGDVGRYRVSFRTDDRVVPHVDRREPALASR